VLPYVVIGSRILRRSLRLGCVHKATLRPARRSLISKRIRAGDRNRIPELAVATQPMRDGSVLCETVDSRTHSGFVPGPWGRPRTQSQQQAWAAIRSAPTASEGVRGSKARYNWPKTKS